MYDYVCVCTSYICIYIYIYMILYDYTVLYNIIHVYNEIVIAWCGVAQSYADLGFLLCYGLLCGLGIALWIAGGSCTEDRRSMCVSFSSQGPNIHVLSCVWFCVGNP